MHYLNLSLAEPAENLALDEALLESAEAGGFPDECLRLWESPRLAVVVGRASRVGEETDRNACSLNNVPILRRCSGGAAVVIGPGCLMYTLVLSLKQRPHLRMVDQAHQQVLQTISGGLATLVDNVQLAGTSDLTIGGIHKFSGNSLRIGRDHLLYHGTILYDFDLPLVGHYLRTPPRQPEYRQGRDHGSFVANLAAPPEAIRRAMQAAWNADTEYADWPRQACQRLVVQRYARDAWNFQR